MKLIAILLLISNAWAVTIYTAHVDNGRTGWNASETFLTPTNVTAGKFGQLGSYALDGFMQAQPLYIPGVTVSGATHTCLIAVTMHNTVNCFDALHPSTAALWSVNLGATYPVASTPGAGLLLYGTELGCLSTPVADVSANRLYVVCSTNTPTWKLWKLNLSTGATVDSVVITGQVVGTGDIGHSDTTSGANLVFYPAYELQRAALTLANNRIYIGFGSYVDTRPYHGWLFAYNTSDLSQAGIYCTSPNGYGAGLWGSSGGVSADSDGNIYMTTGNAAYDGVTQWGESVLKWNSSLTLLDWYTPSNWAALDALDLDLSSGRAMLIPGTTQLVFGAKDYYVYNLNQANMGHLGGTAQVFVTDPTAIPDGFSAPHAGIYGGTLWSGGACFPNTTGKIYCFTRSGTTFNTTPVLSTNTYAFPGAVLSASSNGSSNTIIWATTDSVSSNTAAQLGTLRAFDTSMTELYTDAYGLNIAKFSPPVVADGKVFVATFSNTILVYGLLSSSQVSGQVSLKGQVKIR